MSADLEREASLRRALVAGTEHPVGLAHWRSTERSQVLARIAEAAHEAGESDK